MGSSPLNLMTLNTSMMQSENKTVNNLTGRLLLEESRLLQQGNTCNIDVEKSSAFSANSRSKFGWKTGSHKKSKYNFVNSKKVSPCFYCENVVNGHHIKKECRNYLRKQETMITKSSDKD
ncbi:Uncharacterized protein FWK35_00038546 [Aphis craccivora]|uniref:Uncharacterized protein n=1 Tax=Aphis craccivora TaxID=307492 RepID=A0A6G0W696_APHCR|nr:Uncharacterized protein FWK35_00038546 [Aphis craccivora]